MPGKRCISGFFFLLLTVAGSTAQDNSADQILAQAKSVYSQQGPKAALPEYEKALGAYRQSGNKSGEAITIGLMGNCYKRLGDYPKALELLNASLAMKRELHDRLEEGKTLSNLGLVYWEQGEYQKAIELFNDSIAIAQEVKNVQLQASALNNLSLVYDEQGDYHRSLEQYKRALELHRSINYEPGESDTLGNIGGVFLSLGHFSEAESYYRQALEISRRLESKPSETQDLGNIALCQFGEGKTKESLQTFDEAIAIAITAGMYKEEADWQRGKATALIRVGQFDAALQEYEHSESAYSRAGLKREESEALAESGAAYFELGDKQNAEKQIERAIVLSKQIGYQRGVVLNRLALTEILLSTGDQQRAQQTAELALADATRLDQSEARVEALLLLSKISRDQKKYGAALKRAEAAEQIADVEALKPLYCEALELRGELLLSQQRLKRAIEVFDTSQGIALETAEVDMLWRIQFHRGQALERLHQNEEAVGEYRAAIKTIEDVRSRIAERRFRTGYLQDKQRVYAALISLLLRMGRPQDAFEISEKLREYSFLQLRDAVTDFADPQVAEAKSRVRHLQEMLDAETRKRTREQRSSAIQNYSDELTTAQRELQSLLERGQTLVTPVAARAQGIEQSLPAHTAVLDYVVDDHQVTTFVLQRTGLQAISSRVSKRDLRARVDLLQDLIADMNSGEAWRKPAASLRDSLITPVEKKGLLRGVTTLIVVPHDVLNYVPFSALPSDGTDGRKFLVEKFEIVEVPTASWLVIPPRIKPRRSALLAVAPRNSRLKFAIPEANTVASLFAPDSEALIGSRATETQFKATADRYGIIHLATHGFFNRVNPLFSGVQLEPDAENDGKLQVHEVMRLHLNATLVTLSACDSALGAGDFSEIPAGDEFVGLSRAFLEAGSDAVLASLWKVNDRSTLFMMTRIYRGLKVHGGARALAMAQRAMIANPSYRHPFYWAPFVFIGGEFNRPEIAAEKR